MSSTTNPNASTVQPMPAPSTLPPLPKPSRPIIVSILAVLIGLLGVLFIIGGILLLAIGGYSALGSYFGSVPGLSAFSVPALVVGAIVLVIGLIILGIAVGLWHLRTWALVLALLVLLFELVSYGIAGQFVSVGFLLSLFLFVYLLAVHRHFH